MRNLATRKLNKVDRDDVEGLYKKNEWYVKRLAKYIAGLCGNGKNDLESDLCQEGFLGIARAYELYDPRIASFLTYAQYWIRMAMYSYAYRSTYLVEIPEDFHSLYSKYRKLVKEGDVRPIAEVASEMGISEERARRMISSVKMLKSYAPLEDVDKYRYSDGEIDRIEEKESSTLIRTAKATVTPEEFYVLDHLLALECCTPKTLSWVGKILGVTKERVRQIKNNALGKIKAKLKESKTELDG